MQPRLIVISSIHLNWKFATTRSSEAKGAAAALNLFDKRRSHILSIEGFDDGAIAKLRLMTSSHQFKSNIFQGARPKKRFNTWSEIIFWEAGMMKKGRKNKMETITDKIFEIFVCGHRQKTKELLELFLLFLLLFTIRFISSLKEI